MRIGGWLTMLRGFVAGEQLVLFTLAAVIGVAVAYAALLFRFGIDWVQHIGFGFGGETVIEHFKALPAWQIILVPTLGGLVVGGILHFLLPDKRQQGVAQVIEASVLKGGFIRFRDGMYAALLAIAALGSGSSTGREGPMVHLGAMAASVVAVRLGLGAHLVRTILGCGVAAAVAASFNAPIAGVFFALEVIIGHYAMATFAPVVIAAVAGTMISRIHLGTSAAFVLPDYGHVSMLELPAFLMLGLVCALIASVLVRSIFFAEDVLERFDIPVWTRPVAAGLAVGIVGTQIPHILGVGYQATDLALKELLTIQALLLLIVVKTATTAVSIGCRFGGGIFSPALFIGAMTGGAFGLFAAHVFPNLATGHGAYAIVGMSALAAAVLGAPISTIFIVFELTGDYRVTIATMAATAIASLIANQIYGGSYFRAQLSRLGVNLEANRAARKRARDVMTLNYTAVPSDLPGEILKKKILAGARAPIMVVDGESYRGAVGRMQFRRLLIADDSELEDRAARDFMQANRPVLRPDDDLRTTLVRFETADASVLPVVVDDETARLIGVVHVRAVLHVVSESLAQEARGPSLY